jgi:acetylornithine deacetylase
MDKITHLLADLVAIDSINPDLVPGGAGEGAIAQFIADWLADAGLEVHLDEVRPGQPKCGWRQDAHAQRAWIRSVWRR